MDPFDDFSSPPMPAGVETDPPRPAPPVAPPAPRRAPQPLAAMARPLPAPRSPSAARAKAGLGLVAAAACAGAGAMLAGPGGAVIGVTGFGALRNLYRSHGLGSVDPAEQSEAGRSLALGVVGVGLCGYLAYRLFFKEDE